MEQPVTQQHKMRKCSILRVQVIKIKLHQPTKNKLCKKIGDLPVTHYEKNGQEVQNQVLQSVTATPHGSYNLFSVEKRMKDGCKLYGDIKNISIIKLKKNVEFDL